MTRAVTILAFALLSALGMQIKDPDCSGVERYPTSMAFVHLKNAGMTNNEKLDFTKTQTTRIASQRIAKNLYRQVHLVTFTEKTGAVIQVITVNNASRDECSAGPVGVFVVSKRLGDGEQK